MRRTMVTVTAMLALVAADTAAEGGAAPASASRAGIYKVTFSGFPGKLKLAQDGSFVCGSFAGDDGGGDGWLGGTLAGNKLTGLSTFSSDNSSNGLPINLTFDGRKFGGSYKDDPAAKTMSPFLGELLGPHPTVPNVSGDYTVEWGSEKLVIHLKQTGRTLTAKREYLNSGTPAGTMHGTITGNMATGTVDYADLHGRFQWIHSTSKLTWLAIDGTYGVDRDHCDNGGYVKGGRQ